ncbi:Hypothetical protein RY67_1392 [Bifidobacterium longum subsp. infantis]|uniref:Uncharacterized protein n=1 Tax=Bifidobacterium longum subsp. infantis TaxID=1682 RepID=A0A0M4MET3_BIFLI|nr:Hypothetical protein RY67_1392 [Bifidobacterium longum subsp. infantis]
MGRSTVRRTEESTSALSPPGTQTFDLMQNIKIDLLVDYQT